MFSGPAKVRWLVAFTDLAPGRSRVRRALQWLQPGYRHCFAFRGVPGGVLLVQMTVARLEVEYLPGMTEELYAGLQRAEGATIAVLEAEVDDALPVMRGTSCVTIVRALAGLPGKIQTPFGLARSICGNDTGASTWSRWRRRLGWAAEHRRSERPTRSATPAS